jgi:hypothetical protein
MTWTVCGTSVVADTDARHARVSSGALCTQTTTSTLPMAERLHRQAFRGEVVSGPTGARGRATCGRVQGSSPLMCAT